MTTKTDGWPILVPVDFSSHSRAALLYAAELADKLHARLTVLHVVHDPGEAPGYYAIKGRDEQLRRLEDVAADMLAEFMREIQQSCPQHRSLRKATTMLVTGLPVNRILEAAQEINARMIVMGSQGRTGLARALLGSKAEQVVRLAPIPVTIVKDQLASLKDPE